MAFHRFRRGKHESPDSFFSEHFKSIWETGILSFIGRPIRNKVGFVKRRVRDTGFARKKETMERIKITKYYVY